MSSWFSSLETVARLHSLMSWITILAAVIAVACGILAYILSNQASALREKAAGQMEPALQAARQERAEFEQQAIDAEQLQQQLKQEMEGLQATLDETRRQAQQLEEETQAARLERDAQRRQAEAARAQASQKQSELQEALSELEQLKSAQQAEAAPPGTLSPRQRGKLLRSLSGKPSGEVTLVAVAGEDSSTRLAQGLQEALRQAGWSVVMREGRFAGIPEGLYFVVHSQESMPQYTLQLAVGLAVIDLMPIPAKIRVNPEKPPGSLGLVIGAVKP